MKIAEPRTATAGCPTASYTVPSQQQVGKAQHLRKLQTEHALPWLWGSPLAKLPLLTHLPEVRGRGEAVQLTREGSPHLPGTRTT